MEGGAGANLDPRDRDRREWENPDNWTLPIGFYFSKRDSRWLVPRPNRSLGWTFNLGHPKGAWAMLAAFLGPTLLVTAVLLAVVWGIGQPATIAP